MSSLKVRKIDFQFADDIALQWCPENPWWGNFVNYATLIAPPFERYVIRATRSALGDIKTASVREEAELFCHQEAQHSLQHLAHLAVLTRKYPGLEQTRIAIQNSYDQLMANKSQAFHLAYAATIELMFGPSACFLIEQREALFGGSDPRIASFMLWHLVEEFEHRHCAINVYNEVVGSHWYRLKCVPAIMGHVNQLYRLCIEGFEQHIPKEDWDKVGPIDTARMFDTVPWRHKLELIYQLACTLLPYHNPDSVRQPAWAKQWFIDEEAGKNMALYYP